MKRIAIVSINMEYELPDSIKTEEQLEEFLHEVDLPENYIEDSFEFVKVIDAETQKTIFF